MYRFLLRSTRSGGRNSVSLISYLTYIAPLNSMDFLTRVTASAMTAVTEDVLTGRQTYENYCVPKDSEWKHRFDFRVEYAKVLVRALSTARLT